MRPSLKTYTVDEARLKLENYCIYQDRCHQEVEQKLREMRMIPQAVEQIIMHLIQENYLNEERFAKSYARGKFKTKKWGKIRIANELKFKGVSRRNIDTGLKEIPEADYYATFQGLVDKRLQQLDGEKDTYKKRKKLADYLSYRGWPMHWVYESARERIP